MKTKAFIPVILVLCSLILASVSSAANSDQYAIEWNTINSGGAPMTSSTYSLDGSLAQPAQGISSSLSYGLCAGYWCHTNRDHTTYLPLVMLDS